MDFYIHFIRCRINSMGNLLAISKSISTQDFTFTLLKNTKDFKVFESIALCDFTYQHLLLIYKLQILYIKFIILKRFTQLNINMLVKVACLFDTKERIRILNKNFLLVKCRFRRRMEVGEMFYVPLSSVKLKMRNGKIFYEISKRTIIPVQVKIFDVTDSPECIICVNNLKSCVFLPCGHFACCKSCADHFVAEKSLISMNFKNCPICKHVIYMITDRKFLINKI